MTKDSKDLPSAWAGQNDKYGCMNEDIQESLHPSGVGTCRFFQCDGIYGSSLWDGGAWRNDPLFTNNFDARDEYRDPKGVREEKSSCNIFVKPWRP
jgi:hypothetical protein